MAWWGIFCGIIIEVGVAVFFACYILQRSNLPDDGLTLTKIHHKIGCVRVLQLPLAPGIFATVYFCYLLTIMFLFTPLHPTPNDTFWQFVNSGLKLTVSVSFPIAVLAIMETVVAVRSQQINVFVYFVERLTKLLFVLVVGQIAVWFVLYA